MDANDRRARATEEATHWWTRLGTRAPAEVTEIDREEFTQWLRESPLHVAELLHVAHVHDTLERFDLWREIPLQTDFGDDNVIPLGARPPSQSIRSRLRHAGRVVLAASVTCVAIAAGFLSMRLTATTYSTERAERREVVLTDGSVMNLEPETTVRVDLGKSQRNVTLRQGRAVFHVAKDSARAFTVHAGNTNVRALGTVFGVEEENESIIVTVSEGKVAVLPTTQPPLSSPSLPTGSAEEATTHPTGPASSHTGRAGNHAPLPSDEVFLTANQRLTVKRSGSTTPIERVDSTRALAWTEGRLVFDSTSLTEVAAQFNRYNHVQLRIDGAELGKRTISGVFKASDPQTLIDFIGAGAHVMVTRRGTDEIVIASSRK